MAKAVEKQEPKVKRINRAQAANQMLAALSGKATLSELAEQADALYVEHGGESKLKAAAYHMRRVLEVAETLGAVKLVRPADVLVERLGKK